MTKSRNLKLYPYYVVCIHAMAWVGIFFLFFSSYLTLSEILLLEAVYYISVVILEVPSGYFSDKIGRRITLVCSAIFFSSGYLIFYFSSSFEFFAMGQIAIAAGMAFLSGTDTSFHYESLVASNLENEYAEREAKIHQKMSLASGIAVLIGGFLGIFALKYAYLASFVTAFIALIIALNFKEPSTKSLANETPTFFKQLRLCLNYLYIKPLGWIFGFSVFLYILAHIPYEFYQPYLDLLEKKGELIIGFTPLISGIIYWITRMFAAWAAGYSVQWRNKIGLYKLMLIAVVIQVLIMGAMGAYLSFFIIGLILCRSISNSLVKAPINAEISPRVKAEQRATYFSIQSLISRLGFSALLFIISISVAKDELVSWPVYQNIMLLCAAGALLIALVLFALAKNSKSELYHPSNS